MAKLEPASIRHKNPGAMWGGAHAKKWGALNSGKGTSLADGTGQGNTIATFPTFAAGIAAQVALWRTARYRNKPFAEAIVPWSGNNNVPSYIRLVAKRVPGFTGKTVINDAFLLGPHGIEFLKAQAYHEAGKEYPASAADWAEGLKIGFGNATPPKVVAKPAAPIVETAPAPVAVQRPGIFGTLWNMLRGKDASVETKTEKARPGLHPNGDATLYDQQEMLSSKGWVEVGKPDGLMGTKTMGAIRDFRRENGLPPGDAIDAKFASTLLTAGPRQVAAERAEATAKDLRSSGNSQVATLDGFGWVAKALVGGGLLGGAESSGVLSKANETLQSAQDTLGTVATVFTTIISIGQWCFAHWWIFALGGGIFMLYRVAMAVLNMVVLFRQGFLARADK